MSHAKVRTLLLAAAILPLAATAQTVVPVSAFNSIELKGGGHIVLKHGDQQRVTLLKGSTQYTSFTTGTFDRHKLTIDACNANCPMHYDLEIEIETPDIVAVAISGGGHVESVGGFPDQHSVTAAVDGGGKIDLRSIDAANATAAIDGGGDILVRAEKHLTAAIDGGGRVTYWGDAQVTEAIDGGGEVRRGS